MTISRQDFSSLSHEYFNKIIEPTLELVPGLSYLPTTSKCIDATDLDILIQSSLDMWLTAGRFSREFETQFPMHLGKNHSLLVNSGSSANLLAVTALSSHVLGDMKLKPGDEIITSAVSFPTTVNPIFQNGYIPKFVDSDLNTLNPSTECLMAAITEKTKAVILAHTLGNPWDVKTLKDCLKDRSIFIIEDCCDALGSTLSDQPVGSFGDLATSSFYPAHHITMGEGGAVSVTNKTLKRILESLRDWGRDCWCQTGRDNTCGKRFEWQLGTLPHGYDHKYIYSHLGYNLKLTDMQAALGVSQLKKLTHFVQRRKDNWDYLFHALEAMVPEHISIASPTPNSAPSWFGFPIICKNHIDRKKLTLYLETHKIGTRLIFGGNIVRQPAYKDATYRVHDSLKNADIIAEKAFWVGIHPRFSQKHLDYIGDHIKKGVHDQIRS